MNDLYPNYPILVYETYLPFNTRYAHFILDDRELFCYHDFDKLVVVDLFISIYISFTNHLINFLIYLLLTEVSHDTFKEHELTAQLRNLEMNKKLITFYRILFISSYQSANLEIDHPHQLNYGQ